MDATGGRETPALIGVQEAARIMGITPRVVYGWVKDEKFPAGIVYRPSRAVYFVRGKLLEWLGTMK